MVYCHFCGEHFPKIEVEVTYNGVATVETSLQLENIYAMVVCQACRKRVEAKMKRKWDK